MKHKMTLGPAQICPECDGHCRVICDCVPRDPCVPVEELVGEVGCPECDGDGGDGRALLLGPEIEVTNKEITGGMGVPIEFACTCDENCDEPCKACNRPTVQAARTAYRMGRKDARRYVDRSLGEANVDSGTVDSLAELLWSVARGATLPSQFEDLADKQQTKLRMVVRRALALIGDAVKRHLDECPDEPVSFEAIASAAEMENAK